MLFFPNHSEVLVSALKKSEVLLRLEAVTRDPNFLDYESRKQQGYFFNGTLQQNGFRISQIINKADSFLPLIRGRFEETPNGCILFLNYSLFPGSTFFLAFWSILTMLLALFFGFIAHRYTFAAASIILGLGNYVFAWTHFKRKIVLAKEIFHELLK